MLEYVYENNSHTKAGVVMKGYQNKQELEDKYKELKSMLKVAQYYGVSKKLILNYMNKFEIPRNEMGKKIDTHKAKTMLDNGYRLKDVAKELKISMTTAREKLKAKGIESDRFHKHYREKDSGYILILKPSHPRADKSGYVPEHTLVMEQMLGRLLKPDEVVHHINGNKSNNQPENLRLMTAFQHKQLHSSLDRKTVDIEYAAKMLDEGYTLSEVSKKFNVCIDTIRAKLKRYGLYKPLPKGTPAHKDQRKRP
jgi:DNA-binding NtrC family response regulator